MENRLKTIRYIFIIVCCLCAATPAATAQENNDIRAGNKLYRQGNYNKALPEYQTAIKKNPKSAIANYNMGNTHYRNNDYEGAVKQYDEANVNAPANDLRQKALYNKGVALLKQQKLQESIDTWKTALAMNPADQDTRINLQKALTELRRQKEQKEQKQQQQNPQQQQKQQQKPKPQQSKLDKKKIEQYLKSLQQKEQEVQRKIQQNRSRSVTQPEKDW
jgi:Ca-activated chloride channel homolog